MANAKRLGPAGAIALAFIRKNPGVTIRDVDRAVRTARNGHKYMYATVHRLIRNDFVDCTKKGGKYSLFAL